MEQGRDRLPKIGNNALSGQIGEAAVEQVVLEMGYIYRRRESLDYGLDGTIEISREDANGVAQATGREIGVQVKRGLSIVRTTRYGRTYYCTVEHGNYWLGHSLPIIVVHCDPTTKRSRWAKVSAETLRRTTKGFAIDLPEDSDLTSAAKTLKALANATLTDAAVPNKTLLIPYDFQDGVKLSDEDLGIAALEVGRRALRDASQSIHVEVEGEPDLVAGIAAAQDMATPTSEERRQAIQLEDTLSLYRRHADKLQRALTLLLTDPRFASAFGYNEQWFVDAIRRVAPPWSGRHKHSGVSLHAWPSPHLEHPTVTFDVPEAALEELYSRDSIARTAIRMGSIGMIVAMQLPDAVIATHFLPALAHRLVVESDIQKVSEAEVLNQINVDPTMWLIGIA